MTDMRTAGWPIDLASVWVRERHTSMCILQVRDQATRGVPSSPLSFAERGREAGSSVTESLGRAFDVDWPLTPNTVAARDGCTVLWMAPGEWAITDLAAASVAERAVAACGSTLYLLTDVTDGRIGFDIGGALSRELLAKGCSLDLHPRVFRPGACAQTLLAQVPVLLYRTPGASETENAFRLHADVSVAAHLRSWFKDAALEFAS